jgi:hypothetical protein
LIDGKHRTHPTNGPSDHPDMEADARLTKSKYKRMSRLGFGASSVTSYGQLSELRVNEAQ